jgi:hypothetical protein
MRAEVTHMGRLLAFLLGGVALALYGPHLFMTTDQIVSYEGWWRDKIGQGWYDKVFRFGPGILAGLALILFAIRGKETPAA